MENFKQMDMKSCISTLSMIKGNCAIPKVHRDMMEECIKFLEQKENNNVKHVSFNTAAEFAEFTDKNNVVLLSVIKTPRNAGGCLEVLYWE